jgi:UDP-glucose 4,6-dehydratase
MASASIRPGTTGVGIAADLRVESCGFQSIMIFLLGASGYVGGAFQRELVRRGLRHEALARATLDYSRFRVLAEALKQHRPKLVIHCGGFTGKPNVDACETARSETILGNIVLAQTVAQACDAAGVRLGAVSSGCVYSGVKVRKDDGTWTIRPDLNAPDLAAPLRSRSPTIRGFDESDAPNFTFEHGSSFYSGTKAIAEKTLLEFPTTYVWRLRMPFEERDHPRNYLSKLQTYPKLYQNWNSLSHLGDFVTACLQTWEADLPGGAYNVVNSGYVSTREVVALIQKLRRPGWEPDFWRDDAEFYREAARAPRSNCLLESEKLAQAGIKLRNVETALVDCIEHWKPAS